MQSRPQGRKAAKRDIAAKAAESKLEASLASSDQAMQSIASSMARKTELA